MSPRRCIFCGKPAKDGHHVTGRDGPQDGREVGRYLDPMFVLPVCHDHHELGRDDRHTLGLERVARPLPWIERVEIRLRRTAADVSRLAEVNPQHPLFAKVAAWLVRMADDLAAMIARLDVRDPKWREDPGFYPTR